VPPNAEVSIRKRRQRSSGTAITARDLLGTWRPGSREAVSALDVAAINRGEGRTVFCSYRGLYGSYPRQFAGCMLDLTPDGPVIRPMLFLRFLWQRVPISEPLIEAEVRPFASQHEARQLAGSGQYAPGGLVGQAGSVVISCRTSWRCA
jgi:hypothetical protein